MSLLLLLTNSGPPPAAAGHFKSAPLLGLGGFGAPAATETVITSVKGNLALTGKQPTLTQPRSIAGVNGSLTLTGRQPTLTQTANQAIEGVKGTLTLTGSVATVAQTANQSIAATTGHLTATGYAPGVERQANQTVGPPDVGHLTLTGQQATLSQPQTLIPTQGSLSLTGQQPTVTQAAPQGAFFGLGLLPLYLAGAVGDRTIEPGKGNLALGGKVATVGRDQSASPTKGALTLTGKVATVGNQAIYIFWDRVTGNEGYRVKWGTSSGNYSWSADTATDTENYTLQSLTYGVTYYVAVYALVDSTEQEASSEFYFTAGIWHMPTDGALTLGGKVATVTQSAAQTITGVKGNLALGGKVASLTQPQSASPAAGSLTLTGKAATVGQSQSASPTAGSLTLTGQTATVAQTANQVIAGVAGSLTLTGSIPSLQVDGPIGVDAQTGSLSLRGYAPTITGPYVSKPGAGGPGGGRGRKPRRVIWVEPDDNGPVVEVETAADVPKAVKAIKRQAKAIAERSVEAREAIPELPRWVVHGDAPFADDLRRRIEEIRANFAYVYQLMLIEQRRREDEDEDELILLMYE